MNVVKTKRVQIRQETVPVWDRVCDIKGWTDTEAADRGLRSVIATDPELAALRQTPGVPAAAQAGQDKPETAGGTSDDPEAAHAAEAPGTRQTAHAA